MRKFSEEGLSAEEAALHGRLFIYNKSHLVSLQWQQHQIIQNYRGKIIVMASKLINNLQHDICIF
jgi:hypothetical protein